MVNAKLIAFIKEARKRGFDDYNIRKPLLASGWPAGEVESAFISLKPKPEHKHQICFYIDSEVLKKLERRAKRNMFTIEEQVSDIVRRSVANARKSAAPEKLDDMFVTLFSRKRR